MQLCGTEEVRVAIERGDSVSLILVKRGNENQAVKDIISMAEKLDIRVIEGSENDLWRMARNNSDGTPDKTVVANNRRNAYSEYKFTEENLPQFTAFMVKVVMTSTNQAESPRFKNFRSIALRSFNIQ